MLTMTSHFNLNCCKVICRSIPARANVRVTRPPHTSSSAHCFNSFHTFPSANTYIPTHFVGPNRQNLANMMTHTPSIECTPQRTGLLFYPTFGGLYYKHFQIGWALFSKAHSMFSRVLQLTLHKRQHSENGNIESVKLVQRQGRTARKRLKNKLEQSVITSAEYGYRRGDNMYHKKRTLADGYVQTVTVSYNDHQTLHTFQAPDGNSAFLVLYEGCRKHRNYNRCLPVSVTSNNVAYLNVTNDLDCIVFVDNNDFYNIFENGAVVTGPLNDNVAFVALLARFRNKIMHALNGNIKDSKKKIVKALVKAASKKKKSRKTNKKARKAQLQKQAAALIAAQKHGDRKSVV